MKRTIGRFVLFLLAAAAGWGTSELLQRSRAGGEFIGRFFAGEAGLRIEGNLRNGASGETPAEAAIDREIQLLRDQFGDDERWSAALGASNLSLGDLRAQVSEHLRERLWIEQQIAEQLRANEDDIRHYYDTNRAQFAQPERFRASHLFVAAPDGAPPDVIAAKLSDIEGLSVRVLAGEKFSALIAEASEDEATKGRGGDLEYFSASRMPPEFIGEVQKLHAEQISGPIRSHLGFHLVQLTDRKPAREMSFEEARPEIALLLSNQRRALAVAALRERLSAPEFQRQ